MRNYTLCFIFILLSYLLGWVVGVGWGRDESCSLPPDTIYVRDTVEVIIMSKPDTLIVSSDNLDADSLQNLLRIYYAVVDSLFDKVSLIARMDSTTKSFDLSVEYHIPINRFHIGLKLFKETEVIHKPIYVKQPIPWWEHFSLYMNTDLDVGIGYSAITLTYNLNNKGYGLIFNPRISDIRRWRK